MGVWERGHSDTATAQVRVLRPPVVNDETITLSGLESGDDLVVHFEQLVENGAEIEPKTVWT